MKEYTPSNSKYNPQNTQYNVSSPNKSNINQGTYRHRSDIESLSNNTALSQFQQQYENLRSQFEKLRVQNDEVKLEKRKLQIKLMNTNPEYYDKQIKRLRSQVEKSQQQSQENKYHYIKAENARKQLQASLKVKTDELKGYIKKYETMKISNTQLKYQNEEKDKTFHRVRQELQKSNEFISEKFDQTQKKLNFSEHKLKVLTNQHDTLLKAHQKIGKQFRQLQNTHKKYKVSAQDKIRKLSEIQEKQQNQLVHQKSQFHAREHQLSQQIQIYKSERTSVQLLATKKKQNISIIKNQRQLQLQIVRAQEKIKQVEFQNQQKDQTIANLQQQIQNKQILIQQEISQGIENCRQLQQQKNRLKIQYEREISDLNRCIENMRLNTSHANYDNQYTSSYSQNDFQKILKQQLEDNAKLRKELAMKIDQIFNIKSDMEELKVQRDNMKSDIDILHKMKKSQQKNSKLGVDIQVQNLKNDVQSYQRKIQALQSKVLAKTKQVKEKDNFIISSIVGRSRKEDVPIIMADLQRIFQCNYVQKLAEANKKIDELSCKLKN